MFNIYIYRVLNKKEYIVNKGMIIVFGNSKCI